MRHHEKIRKLNFLRSFIPKVLLNNNNWQVSWLTSVFLPSHSLNSGYNAEKRHPHKAD